MKFNNRYDSEQSMFWDLCQVQDGQRNVCIIELEYGLSKYLFHKRLTKANIDNFLEKYLAGKLRPFVKVEELQDNFDGEIMVTFRDLKQRLNNSQYLTPNPSLELKHSFIQ